MIGTTNGKWPPNRGHSFVGAKPTLKKRLRDADKTKAAWRKTDEVWWPGGPNDPDVCLLRIEPFTAELWDGPASAVVTAFEFAKARLTGEEPKLGENRKVTIKM
jgi:general stress protein 26